MNRRDVLGAAGIVLTTAIAGCSGDGDDDSDGGTDGGDDSGNGSNSGDSTVVDQDVGNGDEVEFDAPDVSDFEVTLTADGDGIEVEMADANGDGHIWVVQPDDEVTKQGSFNSGSTFTISVLRGSGHVTVKPSEE